MTVDGEKVMSTKKPNGMFVSLSDTNVQFEAYKLKTLSTSREKYQVSVNKEGPTDLFGGPSVSVHAGARGKPTLSVHAEWGLMPPPPTCTCCPVPQGGCADVSSAGDDDDGFIDT
jgi:hypothetical protein